MISELCNLCFVMSVGNFLVEFDVNARFCVYEMQHVLF